MKSTQHFLIIDGYPKSSREEFIQNGMKEAGILYAEMLKKYLPNAQYTIIYASDPGIVLPDKNTMRLYDGLLWPGCNLTVFDTEDQRVRAMHRLCDRAFDLGIPQFGSCWGIQIGAFIAGGTVQVNPRGREMGIARKITLTDQGKKHAMFKGKPQIYSHFVSHDDLVTELPRKSRSLAGNDFSPIQAAEIRHKKGSFWGVQYHPEFNLYEMAKLIQTRKEKLTELGFFKNTNDAQKYLAMMEKLHNDPTRKDLMWQLGIDEDILSDEIRQCEFRNWTETYFWS